MKRSQTVPGNALVGSTHFVHGPTLCSAVRECSSRVGASTIDLTAARIPRTVHTLKFIAAMPIALMLFGATAARGDDTVAELDQRLARHGVDAVNAQLLSHGGGAMS